LQSDVKIARLAMAANKINPVRFIAFFLSLGVRWLDAAFALSAKRST
jgi:hypothetical protein